MSSELHPTRIPVQVYYGTDGTHTYGRCRLARVQVTAVQQRRLPACMTRAPSSFNCLGGNCDSVILYACAPARGWLQRVRHNTYIVCYVRLVADHHLLIVYHPPRPANLSRTVILHNCRRQNTLTRAGPHAPRPLRRRRRRKRRSPPGP